MGFFTILLTLLAPVVSVSVTVLTLTPSFASDPDHWKSLCGPWVPPQDAGLWSECWKVCGEVSPWRLSPSFLSTDCGLLWPHTRQPVSSCSYSNIHSWFFITQCRAADWWSVKNSMGIMVCMTGSHLISKGEKTTSFRCHLDLPALDTPLHAARLLPRVFPQPRQSGFNPKTPLCALPALFFPLAPPLTVHLSRSWRTGLEPCPSTRSWGSPCQPNWMNCIRVWVDSTGPKTSPRPRARIRRHLRQRPPHTHPAWRTVAPRSSVYLCDPSELLHYHCGWGDEEDCIEPEPY